MSNHICTAVDCSRPAIAGRAILCAPCLAKRKREVAALTTRWAQAHAEGWLSPEDREDVREGIDSVNEEYALLDE